MSLLTLNHYDNVTAEQWPWQNFSPAEMAVRGGPNQGSVILYVPAMDKLQALRSRLGKPLIVLSAGRDKAWNATVGGASKSQHLAGKAFDISMANHDVEAFVEAAKACGFTGIGYYRAQNFVHIDVGPPRSWGEPWSDREFRPEISDQVPIPGRDGTMTGLLMSGVGSFATVSAEPIKEMASQIEPLIGYSDDLTWVFIALTIIGLALAAYKRIEAERKRKTG